MAPSCLSSARERHYRAAAVNPRRRDLLLALGAGVVTALSVPPFGWWVLGPVGLAGLCVLLRDRGAVDRILIGTSFGAGLYGVGLAWVKEFSAPGMVVWMAFTAVFTGLFLVLVPPGRGRLLGFPAVVVL